MKNDKILIRISDEFKKDFYSACEGRGENPSQVIRKLIKNYIKGQDQADVKKLVKDKIENILKEI